MSTAIGWNASASGEVGTVKARWKEIRSGLRLTLLGYGVLLVLALLGGGLVWLSQSPRLPQFQKYVALSQEWTARLGWVLVATGVALAYLAVLAGQSRCLQNASSRQGAKEFLFTCLLAGLASPVCLLAAFLLGSDPRSLFVEGVRPGDLLRFFQGPGALYLAGLTLLLLNFLLFAGFLRMVAKNVAPARLPWVVGLFWLAAFLVGMTAGTSFMPHAEVWQWLAAGWGVCLLWHVFLVREACRWIDRAVEAVGKGSGQRRVDSAQNPKPYSGLRRYFTHVKKD
jgi:hypothetical protein